MPEETVSNPINQKDAMLSRISKQYSYLLDYYVTNLDKSFASFHSSWQEIVYPNYDKNVGYQQLPYKINQTLPPLDDFPVNQFLYAPISNVIHPYARYGAVRRDCFLYFYLPVSCPLEKYCENWYCIFSHSTLEKMFHPLIYRTEHCRRGINCCRKQCSFLHTLEDDDEAVQLWLMWEKHWLGYRQKSAIIDDFICITKCNSSKAGKIKNGISTVTSVRLMRLQKNQRSVIEKVFEEAANQEMTDFEFKLMLQCYNYVVKHINFKKYWTDLQIKAKNYYINQANSFINLYAYLEEYWTKVEEGYVRFTKLPKNEKLISTNPYLLNNKQNKNSNLPSRYNNSYFNNNLLNEESSFDSFNRSEYRQNNIPLNNKNDEFIVDEIKQNKAKFELEQNNSVVASVTAYYKIQQELNKSNNFSFNNTNKCIAVNAHPEYNNLTQNSNFIEKLTLNDIWNSPSNNVQDQNENFSHSDIDDIKFYNSYLYEKIHTDLDMLVSNNK